MDEPAEELVQDVVEDKIEEVADQEANNFEVYDGKVSEEEIKDLEEEGEEEVING